MMPSQEIGSEMPTSPSARDARSARRPDVSRPRARAERRSGRGQRGQHGQLDVTAGGSPIIRPMGSFWRKSGRSRPQDAAEPARDWVGSDSVEVEGLAHRADALGGAL